MTEPIDRAAIKAREQLRDFLDRPEVAGSWAAGVVRSVLAALEEAETLLEARTYQRDLYRGQLIEQTERAEEAERRIAAVEALCMEAERESFNYQHVVSADKLHAALHPVAETTDDWTDPQPWLYRDGTRTAHKLPQMHVVRRPRIRAEYEAETTESEKNDE